MKSALEWLRDPTDFIHYLRSAGFRIGSGEALRVAAAFERFESVGRAPKDVEAAFHMLAPLLATTALEQRTLRGLIDIYAVALRQGPATHAKRAARQSEIASHLQVEKQAESRPQMSRQFWLITATILGAIVIMRLLFVGLASNGDGDGTPVAVGVESHAVIDSALLSTIDRLGGLRWAILPLFAWLIFRQWNRSRPSLLPRLVRQDSIRSLLHSEAGTLPLFGKSQLRRPLQSLRSHRREPTNALDIVLSVRASAKAGGRSTFIYASTNKLPDYPVIVEQLSRNDHLAIVGRALSYRLREERVEHSLYTYSADPRQLRDELNAQMQPRDLAARHGEEMLWIVSDGVSLIDVLSGAVTPAARAFLVWKNPVLLTPVPVDAWSQREQTLSEAGFIVLPATAVGLDALGEFTGRGDDAARPRFRGMSSEPCPLTAHSVLMDEWHREDPPPREERDRLMADLALHLPGAAFDLLGVLAIFPAVRFDLTFAAGFTFKRRDGQSLLDDETFAALAWLPWFRFGRIPEWLRIELIECIPPARIEEARVFYTNWLAGAERSTRDGAIQIEKRPLLQLTREAARDPKSTLRDAILLKLDQGVLPAPSDVGKPQTVAELLRQAILLPERLALVAALVTGVAGFTFSTALSSRPLNELLWSAAFTACGALSIASWHLRALDVGLARAPLTPLALAAGAWIFLCMGAMLPIYEIGFVILALAPVALALVDSEPRRTLPLKWIENQRLSYLQALGVGVAIAAFTRIDVLPMEKDYSPSFPFYAALLSAAVAVWFAQATRERVLPLFGCAFLGSLGSVFLALIGTVLFGTSFPSASALSAASVGSVYGACLALWTRGRADLAGIFKISMFTLAMLLLGCLAIGFVNALTVRPRAIVDSILHSPPALVAGTTVSCYVLLVHVLFAQPKRFSSIPVWTALALFMAVGVVIFLLDEVFGVGRIPLPFIVFERSDHLTIGLEFRNVWLIPVIQMLMVPAAAAWLSRGIQSSEAKPASVVATSIDSDALDTPRDESRWATLENAVSAAQVGEQVVAHRKNSSAKRPEASDSGESSQQHSDETGLEPSRLSKWMEKITPFSDELAWCHVTDAFTLREIIQRGELFPKRSEVFGEPLSYFFYGRPAYRNDRAILMRTTARAPVVIMMSPDIIASRKRVFPFDSAAFVHGRYSAWMHESMQLQDFEITRLADSHRRYVPAFYASNRDYMTLRPRLPTVPYVGNYEVEALVSMLNDREVSTADDRRFAVELQIEETIPFEWPVVRALIVPQELDSTSFLSSFLAGPGRGIEVRWFDLSPLKVASEYQAQLEHLALGLQAEWRLL